MKDKEHLRQKHREHVKKTHPSFPAHAIGDPVWFAKLSTTNGLTQAVMHLIKWKGWQAERVSNEGRVIDNRKTITNVIGHTKEVGEVKRIPSSGAKGTADIHAIIEGRAVKIEIKNAKTKDSMSPDQVKYRDQILRTGGIYKVIKSVDEAIEWLEDFKDNDYAS